MLKNKTKVQTKQWDHFLTEQVHEISTTGKMDSGELSE